MTQDAWRLVLEEGDNLVLEILRSALRIETQLEGVDLPTGLRDQVRGVCEALVAFEGEASPELSLAATELDEPGRGRAASTRRIYGLVDRLDLALAPLHRLLGTLLNDFCRDGAHADAFQVIVWYAGDLGLARGRFRGAVAGLELDDELTSQLRHLAPSLNTTSSTGRSSAGPGAAGRAAVRRRRRGDSSARATSEAAPGAGGSSTACGARAAAQGTSWSCRVSRAGPDVP